MRDDLALALSSGALRAGDWTAPKAMDASPSAEAAVVSAGLLEADRGAKAAEEAMRGAAPAHQLERRSPSGTLGNGMPFIGLFGTVIGVVPS
jgi:biopolymer transport protein ExbB